MLKAGPIFSNVSYGDSYGGGDAAAAAVAAAAAAE